jgi:(R,R)-butanediol dehydrogenase/meso-butanediol dehydrogenase/diacetyl reductase
MRAALLESMGRPLVVTEVPDPSPLPGEVVVRIDACGICGSDLHASDNLPFEGLVMGHEFCGTVVEVTPQAGRWKPGDRVVALSLATCGNCDACVDGRVRKCLAAQMLGLERPGAYAEFVALPGSALLELPPMLDHRHGALVEPLAVARHAIERCGVRPGEDVAVLGAGPVGLAVTLWLEHLGARNIVVSDPAQERRHAAARLGATATVDPTAVDVAGAMAELCAGAPTRVIECVGVPGLLQAATDVAAVDAVVSIAGVCMAPEQVTPLVAMVKELDVRFAFFYRRQDMETTLAEMAAGRLDPLGMVTDEITLADLPDRFEQLKTPTSDCKVLVRPGN